MIALKVNRSVRELRLCDNGLSSADANQLAALLRLNTRIQLLDLSNNQIQVTMMMMTDNHVRASQ